MNLQNIRDYLIGTDEEIVRSFENMSEEERRRVGSAYHRASLIEAVGSGVAAVAGQIIFPGEFLALLIPLITGVDGINRFVTSGGNAMDSFDHSVPEKEQFYIENPRRGMLVPCVGLIGRLRQRDRQD